MTEPTGTIDHTCSGIETLVNAMRVEAATAGVALWIAGVATAAILWSVWMQRHTRVTDNDRYYGWSTVRIGAVLAMFTELTVQVGMHGWLTTLDPPVSHWFITHRSPVVTAIAVPLTDLASPLAATLIALLGAALLWWLTRALTSPLLLIGIVSSTAGLNSLVKLQIARPRPPIATRLVSESTYSYASGHAAATTALVGAALLAFGSGRGLRWHIPAVLAGTSVVAVIAATRLYLGVHWLTDTIGGALLGITVVLVGALVDAIATGARREHNWRRP